MKESATKKLRIGVVGVGRGETMFNFSLHEGDCELVAICDKWVEGLEIAKKKINNPGVTYYTDYEEFLKHDMDVVMLANYASEHAPFAIKAMKAGKDVISEVLPAQTLAEAVELIECVETTGRKYCYAENYCFMGGPREMRKKYRAGELGEFEYAEGEYVHNCESIWTDITYGEPNHWRNNMHALFYCTHSAGPIIHITGRHPAKVTGFELPFNARQARMGAKAGSCGIEMVQFADGTMFKSIHGGLYKNSIWYTFYGSKGRMETAREDTEKDGNSRAYLNIDKIEALYDNKDNVIRADYIPQDEWSEKAEKHGHGGSDYYCLRNAVNYFMGKEADTVSVYEAIDMWMVGFFGYQSVLNGGIPMDIPDFRDPKARDAYRNDRRCTDPKVAGDQVLPVYSKGTPEISADVYEKTREEWLKHLAKKAKEQ